MSDPCKNCGDALYGTKRIVYEKEGPVETCDRCDGRSMGQVSDVYFDHSGTHHGISDPETGKSIFVTSRQHKADLMKRYQLQERGDRVRGSRLFDPVSYRHSQESLRRTR